MTHPPSNHHEFRALQAHVRPAFRRGLRRALVARGRELGYVEGGFLPLRWAFRAGALAFSMALIATTVFAYESPDVTRTSSLFIVKRIGESLEIAFTNSPEKLVDLHLRLAARRLDEAKSLAADGVVDIPTIAEARANTDQAVAVARAVPSSAGRTKARAKIVSASKTQVKTLTTVSINAQVNANVPMIVLEKDSLAMAPTEGSVLPSTVPATNDTTVEASTPREGTVAGSAPSIPPVVAQPEEVRLTTLDPTIRALNEAIELSAAIAAPTEEEKAAEAAETPLVSPAPAGPEAAADTTDTTPSSAVQDAATES